MNLLLRLHLYFRLLVHLHRHYIHTVFHFLLKLLTLGPYVPSLILSNIFLCFGRLKIVGKLS